MSINDTKVARLRSMGFSGSLPDMENQWLKHIGYSGGSVTMWHDYLKAMGYSGGTSTMKNRRAIDNGYRRDSDFGFAPEYYGTITIKTDTIVVS